MRFHHFQPTIALVSIQHSVQSFNEATDMRTKSMFLLTLSMHPHNPEEQIAKR